MADSIESFCLRAIGLVSSVQTGENTDLMYEKTDILTWANLGLYFSHKLRSAVDYHQFVISQEPDYHAKAVSHLEEASKCWEKVASLTTELYKEVPLQHYNRNKDKYFHWNKLFEAVEAEREWLKNQIIKY